MNLTRRQRQVAALLKSGHYHLWHYSTNGYAFLCPPSSLTRSHPIPRISIKTIRALEEAGVIEEDQRASTYRDGGSDIVYKAL